MRVIVCWYYICADEGLISSGIYQLIQLTDGDWESESLELSRIHEASISSVLHSLEPIPNLCIIDCEVRTVSLQMFMVVLFINNLGMM